MNTVLLGKDERDNSLRKGCLQIPCVPHIHGFSGMLQAKASQPNEPRGWFYCMPRFRQAFFPVLNSVSLYKNCGDSVPFDSKSPPKMSLNTQSAPKRFLVFDQYGDHTILIFGSGINGPVNKMSSLCPEPSNAFTLYKDELESKKDASNPSMQFSPNRFVDQEYETDVRSEMHEDTEELDALFYSDDEDDYSEDEEEASTGHSPNNTPLANKRVWFDESGEEIASSAMLGSIGRSNNSNAPFSGLLHRSLSCF